MAGAGAERQETGVVDKINNAVKANKKNPITVVTRVETIPGVIKAMKYDGRQVTGSEPYIDVVFKLWDGEELGFSMKGESAPSLAVGFEVWN